MLASILQQGAALIAQNPVRRQLRFYMAGNHVKS